MRWKRIEEQEETSISAKRFDTNDLRLPKTIGISIGIWAETETYLFDSDGKQYTRKKPETALKIENLVPTIKHGGSSIQIWGFMGG